MKKGKSYKETHTIEERKSRVKEQREKYPDMVPIIVERAANSKLADLQRSKYLVNAGFKFSDFKTTIKKKLALDEKTATLFLYNGQRMINEDQTLQVIYENYHDKDDGFLYLTYSDSEVFG